MIRRILLSLAVVLFSLTVFSQQTSTPNVPRLLHFGGTIKSADGTPRSGVVGVMFSLYTDQQGGTALWTELQNVTLDANGQYTVLLGSQHSDGVPAELFTTNEARWLGIQVEADPEQPRVLLVSVPYALKAGDAETLGGMPLSSFVLTPEASNTGGTSAGTSLTPRVSGVQTFALNTGGSGGSANAVAKWTDASTLGSSILFDNGTQIGVGTTTPHSQLDLTGDFGFSGNADPPTNGGVQMFNRAFAGLVIRGFNTIFETLQPAPTEAMRLTSTGNLGIGTSNPKAQLDIAKDFTISGNAEPAPNGGVQIFNRAFAGLVVRGFNTIFETLNPNPVEALRITYTGNVGIGNASPGQKLSVAGTIQSTSGGFMFPDGSVLTSGNNPIGSTVDQVFHVTQTGAGAGTLTIATLPTAVRGDASATSNFTSGVLGSSASPSGFGVVGENLASSGFAIGAFGVSTQSTTGTGVWGEAEASSGSTVGVYGVSFSNTASQGGTGVYGHATGCTLLSNGTCSSPPSGDGVGVYGLSDSPAGTGVWGDAKATSGATFGVYGSIASADPGAAAGVFDNSASGNLVIGRTGPTNSRTKVFRIDTTGKGFFNGSVQTGGADFAESVDVIGKAADYQPGDVLIIDPSGYRRLALASQPYSTKVAGIYSTKPGVLATPHTMDDPRLAGEVPLAVVGIVPCKVSTENGPVEPGDLLVASSTPGYAMKGTDRGRMMGAVVGKAMQSLKHGSGVIEVLVSLN